MTTIRFYLETSERSVETHAVRIPETQKEGMEEPTYFETTACGHGLDASWEPANDQEKEPWPTCTKCYQAVTKRGWWPWKLDLPAG